MKTILVLLLSTAALMAGAQDTSVIRMEYFIDQDPGVGKATSLNIPAAGNVSFPFTVNLSAYSIGYHKLYIRTRDNLGRWSLTAKRSIEKISPEENNNVVNGEYFIDVDPGYGKAAGITISPAGNSILQNFTAATAGLPEGFHKLYGRLRDTHGNWSQTFRRTISIIMAEDTKIVNGEYFFKTDLGFGKGTPVTFTTPAANGQFTFTLAANQLPADADTLFVRVRNDLENKWSLTRVVAVAKGGPLPLTLLSFSAVKQANTALLHWQTDNEVHTDYFNVQRSADALHFTNIGVVKAANKSGVNDYTYADNITGLTGPKLYYRLQEMDLNARTIYSDIVAIDLAEPALALSIYPNPANDYFNLVTTTPEDLNGASVSILDLSGKEVFKKSLRASANQKVLITTLPKGMYIVRIMKTSGVITRKLLKE